MPLIAAIVLLVIIAPPLVFYFLQTKYSTPNHNLPNLYKFQKGFIALHILLTFLFFSYHILELNQISFKGVLFEKVVLWLYIIHLIVAPIFVDSSIIKVKFFQNYFKLFVFTPLLFLCLISFITGSLMKLIIPFNTYINLATMSKTVYENDNIRIEKNNKGLVATDNAHTIFIKKTFLEYSYPFSRFDTETFSSVHKVKILNKGSFP